jgi:hypothetical protein
MHVGMAVLVAGLAIGAPALSRAQDAAPASPPQDTSQPAPVPEPDAAKAPATKSIHPFGALTLFVLMGTLFVGVIVGTGIGSFNRRRSGRGVPPGEERRREPAMALAAPPAAPIAASLPSTPAPAPLPDEDMLPVFARLALPFDANRARALARLVERLASGPDYGPRIVAFAAGSDPDAEAQVIAQIAESARQDELDTIIVDCAAEPDDRLVRELDLVVDADHDDRDSFGARARIEIVAMHELLAPGQRPNISNLRPALRVLAARADVVLVRTSADPLSPAIYGAVDEIVLLCKARDAQAEAAIIERVPALLRFQDRVAGTILVTGRAA